VPSKPKPTVKNRAGQVVPNRAAGGGELAHAPRARGLRYYGNPEHIRYALDLDVQERKASMSQAGRYSRTVEALMSRFGCSASHAKRAIAAMRAYRMDALADKLPGIAADLVEQWQEIADKAQAAGEYTPAVAALREIGKVAGVYAPKEVKVTHVAAEGLSFQLDAILGILSEERGRPALRIVLEEIEAAKADGRLALPAPEDETGETEETEEIEDAEVVGDGDGTPPGEDAN
jgi:hypothetical protein